MWKNNRNNVNKMFKREPQGAATLAPLKCFVTYPQTDHKQKSKMFLIKNLKQTMHIFTLLIVIINFYT